MQENVTEYKSIKSNSTYTVTTENGRAYLGVTGEAATNPKVIAEKERIRKSGGDEVELVKWIARKCDKYPQFVQAFARRREGKASILVNPEKAYKFQAEYMPLLEQICGPRLGENPNDPTHPLYRWKA